ncbi:MAG: hypothetical protein K8H86_13060 [Ignavibacteriaceae bacterium]|nr:hypothetical protein [Ignavibacteriaceae bacterium]
MKNQYFGDINDYKKYGILRILTDGGKIGCAVCWMLTENDGKTDGKFTDYLNKPFMWRKYDPELFDWLTNHFSKINSRDVLHTQHSGLLESCLFYSQTLTDNSEEREKYFSEFLVLSKDSDLIFFDPDNGVEVKSKPFGTKNSCKYLYWKEVMSAFEQGHSLLIYQHFSRIKRDEFVKATVLEIKAKMNADTVISLRTSNVVFFLILQNHHNHIKNAASKIEERWGKHVLNVTEPTL